MKAKTKALVFCFLFHSLPNVKFENLKRVVESASSRAGPQIEPIAVEKKQTNSAAKMRNMKGRKNAKKAELKGAATTTRKTKRVQRGNNSNEKGQQCDSCCSWFISIEYPVRVEGV